MAQLEEYYAQLAYHYREVTTRRRRLSISSRRGMGGAQRYANRGGPSDALQQALERVQMGAEYVASWNTRKQPALGLFPRQRGGQDYERLLTSARQRGNRNQELGRSGPASASYIISIDAPDFAAQSLEPAKQAYSLAHEPDDKVGMVDPRSRGRTLALWYSPGGKLTYYQLLVLPDRRSNILRSETSGAPDFEIPLDIPEVTIENVTTNRIGHIEITVKSTVEGTLCHRCAQD